MRRMIFGLGTGRCGSWSLYKLLDEQKHIASTHERGFLPWKPDLVVFWRWINRYQTEKAAQLESCKIVANTSWVWINYVDEIMSQMLNPKCICMKRDRQEMIESFMEYTEERWNHWTKPDSKHWDKEKWGKPRVEQVLFPQFDLPLDKALGAYWDEYYKLADYWASKFPCTFRIYNVDMLNHEGQIKDMLDFCEIPEQDQSVMAGIKLNTRTEPRGEIEKWDGDILDLTN
jgi:hypothetical protein